MAYDEELAARVKSALSGATSKPAVEKKMFGGVAFMINGNMCVGVAKNDLMVRVGPEKHDAALKEPGARLMDMTHRPVVGFLFVDPTGYGSARDLQKWIRWSLEYVDTLPAKNQKAPKGARSRG